MVFWGGNSYKHDKGLNRYKNAKIKNMFKERKIWSILRKLEKTHDEVPVLDEVLISAVLKENNCYLPWMKFRNGKDIMRTFQSLVAQKLAWHETIVKEGVGRSALKTDPLGDGYFFMPRFLNKVAEELGFWKIITIIVTVLSFVPNGIAYKIIDYFIK